MPIRMSSLVAAILAASVACADDDFASVAAPFLTRYCHACHGPQKQTSGIRYDTLDAFKASDRDLWTMVHAMISEGAMPPADRLQPAEADRRRFLEWIETRQRALGIGGTRRLNRREAAAALRDLAGLDIDYAHALPGDGTVAGFDTGADGLQDAADGIARWMVVSRRAVDGIRFLEPAPARVFAFDLTQTKDLRKTLDTYKAEGLTAKGQGIARPGLGMLLEPRSVGERDSFNIVVPVAGNRRGIARLALTVSVFKPMPGLPHPRLWVDAGGKDIDFAEVTAAPDKPVRLVYKIQLDDLAIQSKGLSIHLAGKVEIPYAVAGFPNDERANPNDKDPPPDGTGLYRPAFDRKLLPPEKQPVPFLVIHRIEIEPNHVAAWPPAHWRADVGELKDDPACARSLLDLWIDRAWRRPSTDAEREPFRKLYADLRKQGFPFDDALRAAFHSVLLSAPFRYLASPSHPDPVVARHAVASRLSFLLTGAPPDAELRRLAAEGKLREAAVLDAQVDRLLAGAGVDRFVRPFVMQWLEMEQPITIAQSHIQKQDFRFARHLKASMREETIAYVARLFAENRPARELIASDWTMMNDTLARHYGYGPLEGAHLRPVKLRADDPRGGGILGHAGIQSMLCWMGDNWVIYRGAWALRHIFDRPPPPPPLEVPELISSDAKFKGKPFREQLRLHQADGRCAVCHKTIDPVGFAFQNFDLSGRWRDVEHESYARGELDGRIAWRGTGKTRPVDAAGKLPRGDEFRSFAEFKNVLLKEYRADLVRGLLKNLTIYATGRKPDVDDLKAIRGIMNKCAADDFPLRDLLKALVRSRVFFDERPRP